MDSSRLCSKISLEHQRWILVRCSTPYFIISRIKRLKSKWNNWNRFGPVIPINEHFWKLIIQSLELLLKQTIPDLSKKSWVRNSRLSSMLKSKNKKGWPSSWTQTPTTPKLRNKSKRKSENPWSKKTTWPLRTNSQNSSDISQCSTLMLKWTNAQSKPSSTPEPKPPSSPTSVP